MRDTHIRYTIIAKNTNISNNINRTKNYALMKYLSTNFRVFVVLESSIEEPCICRTLQNSSFLSEEG